MTPEFRPDGGFEFAHSGSNSFKGFRWLGVVTGSSVGHGSGCAPSPCEPLPIGNAVDWIWQPPHGFVVTDDHIYNWYTEDLPFERVSFTTESYKGTHYRFTGRFLIRGNYEELKPTIPVLVGHLAKITWGQVTAEEDIELNWFSEDEIDPQTLLHIKSSTHK